MRNLASAADLSLRVFGLTCEYNQNPEVVDEAHPLLGWKLESSQRGVLQVSYRITAASTPEKLAAGQPDAWDSGVVQSSDTTAIPFGGTLTSGADYYWRVTVTDNRGNTAVSETAKFGAGLLDPEDWGGASWISTEEYDGDKSSIYGNVSYTLSLRFNIQSNTEGKGTGASVIFGAADADNFYMYQIIPTEGGDDAKGYLSVKPHERDDGAWIASSPVRVPASVVGQDQVSDAWNDIKIEYENGTAKTYINDVLIDTRTFTHVYRTTGIGFRAYQNANSRERAYYDDILLEMGGQTVYSEDFSDGTWEHRTVLGGGTAPVANGTADVIPDSYEIVVFAGEEEETPTPAVEKYTLEYRFVLQSLSSGVIFGAQDSRNFYMWQFNESDAASQQKLLLRPHIWRNGGASCLGNVDISSAVAWADRYQPHTMRIEVDGTSITTLIDNKQVDSRSGLPFEGYGKLGFRHGSTASGGEQSKFDWIKATDAAGNVLFEEQFDDAALPGFNTGNLADGWLTVGYATGGEYSWQMDSHISPVFRRDFTTKSKAITRAKIYSSALGTYEMYLNGKRVGEDYMAPGWTDYNKRVQYQGYDVTDLMEQGKANAWGVMVSPGWFSGRLGLGSGNSYGEGTAFIGKLVVDYSDGTRDVIVTGPDWKFADSPIRRADHLDGEYYDAAYERGGTPAGLFTTAVAMTGWSPAAIRYSDASARNLVAQVDPPVRITEELAGKDMWVKDGKIIVDFGQNFAGVVRISLKGAAGTRVMLRYAEALNTDRSIDVANLRGAKATDYYCIGQSGSGIYQPRFTFHGFRYAEISGIDTSAFKLSDITGVVLGSDLTRTSTFESSSPLVNQLYSNIVWGQRGNYLSIPTDCPQRDERLGWTGDSQVFVRTGSYNMDSVSFYRKFLTDIRDAQSSNGAYPDTAPNASFGGAGDAAWGDAGVIGPWTIYRQYGDVRILTENYAAMKAWIAYYQTIDEDLIIPDCAYGDWLSVGEDTPKNVVATAFFAYSTQLLSQISAVLAAETGEASYTADAAAYTALWNQIKSAYAAKFIQSDGTCGNGSQASYVLSLAFDLVPEGLGQKAADKLADNILNKRGGHLSTGFVTVGRLCPVLSEYGYTDIAYQLLTNKTYPSWGYSIERGATTIWERWNSCLDDGTVDHSLIAMNSLNHYSLGSVGEWMFANCLGIEQDAEVPGFDHFILQPEPVSKPELSFTSAKGTYDSVHGTIASGWSFDQKGKLVYKATVPANTTATLYLPAEENAAVYENGRRVNGAAPDAAQAVAYQGFQNGKQVYELGSGSFIFTLSEPDTTLGDLNQDGKVDASDVVVLRAVIAGGEPDSEQLAAGDLNGDGRLDAEDVALLMENLEILPGDVNGDGKITPLDIMTMRKSMLNDGDTDAQLAAGDFSGNGKLDALDIMLLRKLLLSLA